MVSDDEEEKATEKVLAWKKALLSSVRDMNNGATNTPSVQEAEAGSHGEGALSTPRVVLQLAAMAPSED